MAWHKVLRSPRFARRARQRTRWRIALGTLAFVFLFASVLFLVTRETFSINEVVVSGAAGDLSEAIENLARAELAGAHLSLFPKSNAFIYPKREIADEILKQFPQVETARVRLSSPSRLGITVRERAGVARWCVSLDGQAHLAVVGAEADNETCVRIDGSGVAFARAPSGAGAEYRIRLGTGVGSSVPLLGTRVLLPERLAVLLSFLGSLDALSLSPSRVTLLQGGDVSVEIAGGGRVLAREGADFLKQADNLRELLAEKDLVPRNKDMVRVEYIDVRHGNKLYFKPR